MLITAKALAIWLCIFVTAIANGALREAALIPQFGKTPGLVISGVLLSALILVITFLALPWFSVDHPWQLVAIGMLWLVLTVVFEFTLGRIQGQSWSELLEAYTFRDGNLWPVVLVVTALAPFIAGRLRGLP